MIFGNKTDVSFEENMMQIIEKDMKLYTSLQTYFIDTSISFQSFWIFIPFLNLVFLPKLFRTRNTQYVLAIGQGLVITLMATLIGIFFSFVSALELFLLFPVCYGISQIHINIFTPIPIIYEIYTFINTVTFGLLKNTKRIQSIQKQDTQINFKIE